MPWYLHLLLPHRCGARVSAHNQDIACCGHQGVPPDVGMDLGVRAHEGLACQPCFLKNVCIVFRDQAGSGIYEKEVSV